MPETAVQNKPEPPRTKGIKCGPGIGKGLFRIRHTHIAEHYAPLIANKAVGAVKLDMLLRMIALQPEHAGKRQPGFVLWDWHYEHLHDFAKSAPLQRSAARRSDREVRHLKRKWVGNQMATLQEFNLVRLKNRGGARPEIIVLSDRGQLPLDDPGVEGEWDRDRYVTIRGGLIASRTLAKWSAPEVAAYLAALYAEFYTDRGGGRGPTAAGEGTWWRQLAWFNNPDWFPQPRVMLPFSKSLLEDGFNSLADAGLITRKRITRDPRTRENFNNPRVLYRNQFQKLDKQTSPVSPDVYASLVAEAPTTPLMR